MDTTTEDLLTSEEARAELGVDRSTLHRRVRRGDITPARKLPGLRGAFLFTRAEIERAKGDATP